MTTQELMRIIEPPRSCSYLPEQTASLEYRLLVGITDIEYEGLLERGWRRFGRQFFRPACPTCRQCVGIRVDITAFEADKSQRRCLTRNVEIRVELARPTVTRRHLELYNAYHAAMQVEKGWRERALDRHEYAKSFLEGRWPFAHEMRYFRGDEMVGIGLVDIVPMGVSSLYFYHAPEWRPDSPGTFSLLQEIALAKSLGKQWGYLGYWIAANRSMAYKAGFRPHELLRTFVADADEPEWQPPPSR